MQKLTVTWNNVFKPTPKRIEQALTAMRRIMAGIAAVTIITLNPWVAFSLVIFQLVLEELAKFIATADQDSPAPVPTTETVETN